MINKLIINGFRTYRKKVVIKFAKVTTITGKSFIGKSNLFRGVYWWARNRPRGNSIINWDEDTPNQAIVTGFVDGHKIKRVKSNSKNYYKLDNEKSFKVLKKPPVPEKISKIINLSETNFQKQQVLPFWFNLTPGQVAKELNSIVDLEIIDTTTTNLASDHRKAKTAITLFKKEITSLRKSKRKLNFVVKLNRKLKTVEKSKRTYKETQDKADLLAKLIESALNHRRVAVMSGNMADSGLDLISEAQNIFKKEAQIKLLKELIAKSSTYKIIIKMEIPDFTSVEKTQNKLESLTNNHTKLTDLINKAKYQKLMIERYFKEETKWEKQLNKKMKNQNRCPLCLQEMS